MFSVGRGQVVISRNHNELRVDPGGHWQALAVDTVFTCELLVYVSSELFQWNFSLQLLSSHALRGWGGLPAPAPVHPAGCTVCSGCISCCISIQVRPCGLAAGNHRGRCRNGRLHWVKCALHGSTGALIWSLCVSEITVIEAKQSQAAFKRGNINKQACTSHFLDAYIIPMVWKWGCN